MWQRAVYFCAMGFTLMLIAYYREDGAREEKVAGSMSLDCVAEQVDLVLWQPFCYYCTGVLGR